MNLTAVYVLWLREMKRFFRTKSRIFGMLVMPLLFMVFFGLGFGSINIPGMPAGINYLAFLIPGIIGMSVLFTSMFSGISVLWDREFGFLKEIMVAPVDRVSIVMGRILGGVSTVLIQVVLIMLISLLFGFTIPGVVEFLITMVFIVLISTTFIGIGLIMASRMKDMHGFNLITQFIIFPTFFLSGALYPITNLPNVVKIISYIDPLTYGVDGMRSVLIGASTFPLMLNLVVMITLSLVTVFLGAYAFEKSESL